MNENKYIFEKNLSFLTVFSVFLMGFIDAYTFSERGGTFVSAQTGNMVSFSYKIFSGQFSDALGHVSVFVGFATGAYIGEAAIQKISTKYYKKYQKFIFIQFVLLLILAIFQSKINDSFMVFFLGLLAGYDLTTFRKLKGVSVNNGIMTGNTKNLVNNLYLALHKKDKNARTKWKVFMITIIIFIIGAGSGTLLVNINSTINLWVAFILNVLIWIYLFFKKDKNYNFQNKNSD